MNLFIKVELHRSDITQVLPYVHPIDLYHLPLTCRRFYQLLRFKEAESLWDFVWENEPSVPQRPSFLGYPRWAALLFGPPVCEVRYPSKMGVTYIASRS